MSDGRDVLSMPDEVQAAWRVGGTKAAAAMLREYPTGRYRCPHCYGLGKGLVPPVAVGVVRYSKKGWYCPTCNGRGEWAVINGVCVMADTFR